MARRIQQLQPEWDPSMASTEAVTVRRKSRAATPSDEERALDVRVVPNKDRSVRLSFPNIPRPFVAVGKLWHIRRGVQRLLESPDFEQGPCGSMTCAQAT